MIIGATKDEMRRLININHPILPVFHVPARQVLKYRYKICKLKECKFKNPPITWGDLLDKDPLHFYMLLVHQVDVNTTRFHALLMLLDYLDKVDIRMLKYEQQQKFETNKKQDDAVLKHIQETYRTPYQST